MTDNVLRDRIMKLYSLDWSYGAIAAQLHLDRNQVAGIVYRAKKAGVPSVRTKAPHPNLRPDGRKIARNRMLDARAPSPVPAPTPKPPAPATVLATPRPAGEGCRYPIGDPREPGFRFCGAEKRAESSYCATHHARCYVPAARREPTPGASAGGMAGADLSRARPAS